MTFDGDHCLVILGQDRRYRIQRPVEFRFNRCLVCRKGDIPWHDQLNAVANPVNTYAGRFEFRPQLSFLAIHVITDPATNGRTGDSADRGILGRLLAVICIGQRARCGQTPSCFVNVKVPASLRARAKRDA